MEILVWLGKGYGQQENHGEAISYYVEQYVNAGSAGIKVVTSDIGNTTILGGSISCVLLTQTSLESEKKNFEKLENAIDIVNNTDIYKYNLKMQQDNGKKHIGFVIGENYKYSNEITSVDEAGKANGVDVYSMVSVLWKAVQEQQKQIEYLQTKINVSEVDRIE